MANVINFSSYTKLIIPVNNIKPAYWASFKLDVDSFEDYGFKKGETLYFNKLRDFGFNDGDFILASVSGGFYFGFGYQTENSIIIRRLLYRFIPKSKIEQIGILINPITQSTEDAY